MRTRDSLVDNEFLFKAESSSDQEKQDEEITQSLTFPMEDVEFISL